MSKGLNLGYRSSIWYGSSRLRWERLVRRFPARYDFIHQIHAADCGQAVSAACQLDMLGPAGRTGVDAIDIYWIHNPLDVEKMDTGTDPSLQSGKVKRRCFQHNLSQIRRANEILNASGYSLSAVQNHYSLLYRASEEAGILDCADKITSRSLHMVPGKARSVVVMIQIIPMPAGSG